jgi:hypothetical protein
MEIKYSESTNGFYIDDENAPGDSVVITEAKYDELLSKQSEGLEIQSDESGYPIAVERVVSLEDLKSAKRSEILTMSQNSANALIAGYPEFERLSWSTQQQEAAKWFSTSAANRNTALVPWCAAAASERGIPLADFVGLVKANADAFTQASATIAGKRQRLFDAIDSAEAKEDLDLINW